MRITELRKFWFGEKFYEDTATHKHFHTVDFVGQPNVDAQIWLTVFGPGGTFSGGAITALGTAAAGVKSYTYVSEEAGLVTQEITQWQSRVRVRRVVSIQFAFHVRLAWAKAEGMIYSWE